MARLPLKPTLLAAAAALALSGPALAQDRPGAAGADMTTAGERASAVEASRRAGEVAPGTLDETRAAGQRVDSAGAADSDMAGRERIDTTGAVGATGTAGATGTTGATGTAGATGAAGTTGATAGTGATTGAGADRRGTPGLDAASRSAAPTAGTTTGAGAGTTPGTTAATGATTGAAATTGATVTDADRSPAGADAVGQEEELREEHGVRRPAEPGTRPEDDRAGYGPAGTAGQGGAAGAGPTGPGGVTGGTTGAGQLGTGGGG